jgi:hypothetical protein
MRAKQTGIGTGLNAGIPMATAQLGTEPGADPEYARKFKSGVAAKVPLPSPQPERPGGPNLRKGVHLDEEYTP